MARFNIAAWMTSYLLLLWLAAAVVMQNVTPGDKRGQDSGSVSDTPCPVLCHCTKYKADCSRNYGKLTYVPRLPSTIRTLDFSYNDLREIQDPNFFINAANITILDLSNNRLTSLGAKIFEPIKRLGELHLGNNTDLGYASLERAVFCMKRLRILSLRNISLTTLPVNTFTEHLLPQLDKLSLGSNHFYLQNLSVFAQLRSLAVLSVTQSQIVQVTTDSALTCEKIILTYSGLDEFPQTCKNGRSLFPRLKVLNLSFNYISYLPKDICLPELLGLNLNGNSLTDIVSGMFSREIFPKLDTLSLENMRFETHAKFQSYAFNNTALSVLTLMFNNIDFKLATVDPEVFAGCTSLGTLQVSHNYFASMSDDKFHQLFAPLSGLHSLYMGDCGIREITRNTFDKCTSLQKLVLYENKLVGLPDGAFDKIENLQELIINSNQIPAIAETTFSPTIRQRLRHLDLSGNPFSCSCELRWFQRWFVTNASLFAKPFKEYTCSNIPTDLATFHMPDQACLLSQEVSVYISITITLLVVILTLTSLLYRYRWHIRLSLYEAFRGRGDRWRRLQEHDFQYDVFVSYASEDKDWVFQHLMPELEGRLGLRLCLHERDFIPGKHIVDNIVHCVESSKKVMMLFSADFARSPWCQFELTLCLTHVMDNDDALLVVRLHDVASRDMTSAMMAVMKTTTYIEWEDQADARASFWGRLRIALQEILPVAVEI